MLRMVVVVVAVAWCHAGGPIGSEPLSSTEHKRKENTHCHPKRAQADPPRLVVLRRAVEFGIVVAHRPLFFV